jgi:hypothetical protein
MTDVFIDPSKSRSAIIWQASFRDWPIFLLTVLLNSRQAPAPLKKKPLFGYRPTCVGLTHTEQFRGTGMPKW